MKRRMGFVSNSSSSSFICGVCNGIESGMDLDLSDVEMFECVNGHAVHDSCATKAGATLPEFDSEDWEARHEVPEEDCPICQLMALSTDDLILWFRLQNDPSANEVLADIKKKYGDYKSFQEEAKKKLGEFKTIRDAVKEIDG